VAYYLNNPSAGNIRVVTNSNVSIGANIGDYIEISTRAYSGNPSNIHRLVGRTVDFSNLIEVGGSSVLLRASTANSRPDALSFNSNYNQPANDVDYILKIAKITGGYECFLNGSSLGSANSSNNFVFNSFMSFDSNSSEAFRGRIYNIKASTDGGASVTNEWEPSASGGTGTTLEDTAGNNDGTLNNFSGTTDSWWVFYSTGISVTATLGTISYSSNDTSVSVTGSFDVVATLGTISYASNDAVITTSGSFDVSATLGTISYTSNNPSVSVTGIIPIAATLGTISYTSNNVTVFVQDGQDIGVVTASFKTNSITVNFRG
jgi:hypothetical protein